MEAKVLRDDYFNVLSACNIPPLVTLKSDLRAEPLVVICLSADNCHGCAPVRVLIIPSR